MAATDVVKIITEVSILVGVIGGVTVNIIVAIRTKVIQNLVNGNATIQQAKIDELHRELDIMRRIIAEQKETAKDLARENKNGQVDTSTS
jgi:hypothetical protein